MTRREKAIRVIDYYGGDDRTFMAFIRRNGGLKRAPDSVQDVLDGYAMHLVEQARFTARLNRENRARREARRAA